MFKIQMLKANGWDDVKHHVSQRIYYFHEAQDAIDHALTHNYSSKMRVIDCTQPPSPSAVVWKHPK